MSQNRGKEAMEYIKHTISFTITNGTIAQFVSTLGAKLIDYLVGTIGLTLINDDTSNATNRKITFQYKNRKPYINITISTSNPSYIYMGVANGQFNDTFVTSNGQLVIDANSTYTLTAVIYILKSDNLFGIMLSNKLAAGNKVFFCNVNNLSTGESLNVFFSDNFYSGTNSSYSDIRYVGEDKFETLGYARYYTNYIGFVNERVILIPAMIDQKRGDNYNLYTDWYIDEIFMSSNTLTIGSQYKIDGKTYLCIAERALVEITSTRFD